PAIQPPTTQPAAGSAPPAPPTESPGGPGTGAPPPSPPPTTAPPATSTDPAGQTAPATPDAPAAAGTPPVQNQGAAAQSPQADASAPDALAPPQAFSTTAQTGAAREPTLTDPLQHRGMPGDFVARPLTLPQGSLRFAFTYYAAFIDATEALGWMPSLAVGITSDLEVGFEVPVRYDDGVEEWTMLDPIPHVVWRWFDTPDLEIGAR